MKAIRAKLMALCGAAFVAYQIGGCSLTDLLSPLTGG